MHADSRSGSGAFRTAYGTMVRRLALWGLFWLAVWLLVWEFKPSLLVGSVVGLQTVNQALPGVLVAVVALIVASIFVLATQVVGLYGSRSALILVFEPGVILPIVRALCLAVASLLIAGQIPDEGQPPEPVTAAVSTMLLATTVLLVRSISGLATLFAAYTAPRNFMIAVTRDVERLLRVGHLGLVVFRGPLLAEMTRSGLRRGESVAVIAGLEGLMLMQEAYIDGVSRQPNLRNLPDDTGSAVRTGWLGDDLAAFLHRAGEEALRSEAPEGDLDAVAQALEDAGHNFLSARLESEALSIIEAITRLGVTSHQVSGSGINIWAYSAPSLSRLEQTAEEKDCLDAAKRAVSGWSLVVSYSVTHFETDHPLLQQSIDAFGSDTPWEAAHEELDDEEWQRRWANKLEAGVDLPHHFLAFAAGHGPHPSEVWPPEAP